MPSYSFYLLDAAGTTSDYLVKACPTDQAARETAARMLPGTCGVEIWRGRCLIAHLTGAADRTAVTERAIAGWLETPATAMAAAAG